MEINTKRNWLLLLGSIIFILVTGLLHGLYIIHTGKQPGKIPLFICRDYIGIRCTVRSNKENPCSYSYTMCKDTLGNIIYRSETRHESNM